MFQRFKLLNSRQGVRAVLQTALGDLPIMPCGPGTKQGEVWTKQGKTGKNRDKQGLCMDKEELNKDQRGQNWDKKGPNWEMYICMYVILLVI